MKCWGYNAEGELGNDSTTESDVPVDVVGLSSGVVALSAGANHTCAVITDGGVECWGGNSRGQLGNNSTTDSHIPVNVLGLPGVTAISVGDSHTCAVSVVGAAMCWGANDSGELGINSSVAESHIPVNVAGISVPVQSISAGSSATCALMSDGTAMCWGLNQLDVSGVDAGIFAPAAVPGLPSDLTNIVTNSGNTCATPADGGAWCWGAARMGELGNGSITPTSVPGPVSDLSTAVTAISVGYEHICALVGGGIAMCWGKNSEGELGTGNATAESTLPTQVSGFPQGLSGISAGNDYTCAVSGGSVWCWGVNDSGQLGNGSTTDSIVPVEVTGF